MAARKRRSVPARSPYRQPVWLIVGAIVVAVAALALVVAVVLAF